MDVTFTTSLDELSPSQLGSGFFEGWPSPPDRDTHWRILDGSRAVALALDGETIVGFANAVGDGVLSAYVPLLEVLPAWRGRGIGTRLVEELVEVLSPCYMVDVACDDDVVPFYERLGFTRTNAMVRRDYDAQAGAPL